MTYIPAVGTQMTMSKWHPVELPLSDYMSGNPRTNVRPSLRGAERALFWSESKLRLFAERNEVSGDLRNLTIVVEET